MTTLIILESSVLARLLSSFLSLLWLIAHSVLTIPTGTQTLIHVKQTLQRSSTRSPNTSASNRRYASLLAACRCTARDPCRTPGPKLCEMMSRASFSPSWLCFRPTTHNLEILPPPSPPLLAQISTLSSYPNVKVEPSSSSYHNALAVYPPHVGQDDSTPAATRTSRTYWHKTEAPFTRCDLRRSSSSVSSLLLLPSSHGTLLSYRRRFSLHRLYESYSRAQSSSGC